MLIPLCYDPSETPCGRGGFADVWKANYNHQVVAAKALRVYLKSDLKRVKRVGCPQLSTLIRELSTTRTAVLQRGYDVEDALPSQRVATDRRYHDRVSARDGVRVDGERQCDRICEEKWRSRPVGTRTFFVESLIIA